MGEIPISSRDGRSVSLNQPFEVRFYLREPERSRTYFARRFPDLAVRSDRLEFRVPGYIPINHEDPANWRSASFVVDYHDPVFARIRKALGRDFSIKPSVAQLAAFVNGYIEHKNLSRGYDVASSVARDQTGDCTEHAVLFAAVARLTGYSARVVHGILFHSQGTDLRAFGHAWTEVYSDGSWHPFDATRPDTAIDRSYLPLYLLTDESALYNSAMLTPMLLTLPQSIELELGNSVPN